MKIEKSVCISDLHLPFQDKKALKLILKFIEQFEPNKIFINGDLIDCWEISKFVKPLYLDIHLVDEIMETRKFLYDLRYIAPDAEIIYIFGNHEFRLETYISNHARELYGLDGLTLEEQLLLNQFKIKPVNNHLKENYYQYGKLLIGHFDKCTQHSGYTAKNLLERIGMSLIQGHTHRGGVSYKRTYNGTIAAFENFCLCDLNPKYCQKPNWQLGFTTIIKDKESDFFKVTPREIVKYKIAYGDKIISLTD
jgi:predicted phosphodiesterase